MSELLIGVGVLWVLCMIALILVLGWLRFAPRVKPSGVTPRKRTGRLGRKPRYTLTQLRHIQVLADDGTDAVDIAARVGLTRQTVERLSRDPTKAIESLRNWGLA